MQDVVTASLEISLGSCLDYSAAATRRIVASSIRGEVVFKFVLFLENIRVIL
jgi:hypothetical protein